LLDFQVVDVGRGLVERSKRVAGRAEELVGLQNRAAIGLAQVLDPALDAEHEEHRGWKGGSTHDRSERVACRWGRMASGG